MARVIEAPAGVEIVRLDREGEWWVAQLAVHGILCIPFDVHESTRQERFPKEEDFMAYLGRQAQTMIELYGDAKKQHRDLEELA